MIFLSALLVACAAAPGPAAQASTIDPAAAIPSGDAHSTSTLFPKYRRWPKRLIRYHLEYPAIAGLVTEAARLWNESGADLHWREVPARRAEVTISRVPMKKYWGWAGQLWKPGRKAKYKPGVAGGSIIKIDPRVLGFARTKSENGLTPIDQYRAVQIVAHEMGHILGLAHTPGCAVMNSGLKVECPDPPRPGAYRCRVLESDDARGAIRLFGGTFRESTDDPWCQVEVTPNPIEDLTATYHGSDPVFRGRPSLELRWRAPISPQPTRIATKIGPVGQCPTSPDGARWSGTRRVDPGLYKGSKQVVDLPPGEWCVAMFSSSSLGMISPTPTTANFTVPG